jgi:hypothetical protein
MYPSFLEILRSTADEQRALIFQRGRGTGDAPKMSKKISMSAGRSISSSIGGRPMRRALISNEARA